MFSLPVVASNPKTPDRATPPVEAVVDTGSEYTWLPATVLLDAGLEPRREQVFVLATGERITRSMGYAIVAAGGYETADDVVFAEPGDLSLLGARTIEGFAVYVDTIERRLVKREAVKA